MDLQTSVVLITGSNMSGKSTFLRTIGINIVLAYAGAPVLASEFSVPLFRLFCCIQVNDSITEGFSQFYAEVKRLKRLQDELSRHDDRPVLFLIDEIFKGTNNRERYLGSRAYIKTCTTSMAAAASQRTIWNWRSLIKFATCIFASMSRRGNWCLITSYMMGHARRQMRSRLCSWRDCR